MLDDASFCPGSSGYPLELADGGLKLALVDPRTSSSVPVAVSGFTSDGAAISANDGGAVCALNNAEQAECWGDNAVGDLGDGSTTDSDVPVKVQGL